MSLARPSRKLAIQLGALAALLAVAAATTEAQVKCYIKKCVEYPDGTSWCERTPVDCATIEIGH
jgi:hypothetical protein